MDNNKDSLGSSKNIKQAIAYLKKGLPVLLLDAHDRENEGDLVIAAEKTTPNMMNFFIKQGSGIVCLVLGQERIEKLDLPMMIANNTNKFQTPFVVSIEARSGVTTGVSAQDRTHTVLVAMDDKTTPQDLARPGHVFPLCAQPQGVLKRMGHTEGAHDLMKLAGLKSGALLCELMNPDGSMTKGKDRENFAQKHDIPILSVEDILYFRLAYENNLSTHQNFSINNTNFSELVWSKVQNNHANNFDIFAKKNLNKNPKVKVINIPNLAQCYIGGILNNLSDDPVSHILQEIKNNTCDICIISYEPETNLALSDNNKIQTGWIARALKNLNISGIPESSDILTQIFTNYFVER